MFNMKLFIICVAFLTSFASANIPQRRDVDAVLQRSDVDMPPKVDIMPSRSDAAPDGPEPRIVGGASTSAQTYPFICNLAYYYDYGDGTGYYWSTCGCSIIRLSWPQIFLTAAHCVEDVTDTLYIGIGFDDFDTLTGSWASLWYVYDWYLHEDYDSTNYFWNDIAMVMVSGNMTVYEQYYEEISFPCYSNGEDEPCYDGELLTAIGYGNDFSGGSATDTLEYTYTFYVDRQRCNVNLTYYYLCNVAYDSECYTYDGSWAYELVGPGGICVYYPGQGTCQGDSGGPLVKYDTSMQVGATSWGYGCAGSEGGTPTMFANVGYYYNWIVDYVNLWDYDGTTMPKCTPSPTDPPTDPPTDTPKPTSPTYTPQPTDSETPSPEETPSPARGPVDDSKACSFNIQLAIIINILLLFLTN